MDYLCQISEHAFECFVCLILGTIDMEQAFAWGFDICEWKKHLSPQTWPEILRQFALAAGYGPRWKKPIVETDLPCEDEVNEKHF